MHIAHEYTVDIGDKQFTAQFTDLADQANGSVILRCGDTAVLATAVMSDETKDLPYFPLVVDYEERFYAAGQILGSRYVRREGRPSEEAVLSGRVVDRTIRPLFDQVLRREVQVVITILSLGRFDPDVLAVNAASLALATSDIPWNGPVSAVRIGRDEENALVTIPTYEERSAAAFDVLACGKDNLINMIEVGAREVPEAELTNALEKAREDIEKMQAFQEKIVAEIGDKKQHVPAPEQSSAIVECFNTHIGEKLEGALFAGPGKSALKALKKEWMEKAGENLPETDPKYADDYFEEQVEALFDREALENSRRPDGRKLDEVRPLKAQAGGISDILHGAGIFYRGGTHVLSALTLASPQESQIVDEMETQEKKHFMHHYNFPPFAPGETGRIGSVNRRMIGHGALAEKALEAVLPAKNDFPYTIRLVSEVMASNGSTSMASVCAGTLALMDGGVPIIRPVAGIAMGIVFESPDRYALLTDIQGPEDEHGDMDFKVAGTREGVTAVQMDVKVTGIPTAVLAEAFEKARTAREQILDVIEAEIAAPRESVSPNAPEIIAMQIAPEKIGEVIGSGGKVINEIKELSKTEAIDIEDDGTIYITGRDGSATQAQKYITDIVREYTPGERFEGEVTKILDFGAFVKIGYNTEGLVHISEIAPFRIEKVEDVLATGDSVPVTVKEIDEKGRLNLSIKAADPEFAKRHGAAPQENNEQS